MYIPDKGDIVWLDFNPSDGQEKKKTRPAFIISREKFNRHTGFAIVAPITSTVKGMNLEVLLTDDLKTDGVVLVHQLRSLDFKQRNVKFIEKAQPIITEEVTQFASVIIK
jgi:mRNA-degrading endonuclease toxin of MazEF toxin-antitoxin module